MPASSTSSKYPKGKDELYQKAYQIFYQARHRAKEDNLEFDLDVPWIYERLINKCAVTGLTFELPKGRGKRGTLSPSIDRINNKLGYIKSNCRLVIWWFNSAKGTLTDCDVWHLCSLIVNVSDENGAPSALKLAATTTKTT